MRETLYRGKRKDNGKWVYGYLAEIETAWDRYEYGSLPTEYQKVIVRTDLLIREAVEIIPETVGQYTGKRLNNSITYSEEKLFSGDIVGWSEDYDDKFGYPATTYGQGVIVWNEANCCFGVKTSETNIQDFNDFDFDDSCVIIGNIHDNPELLEGEDAE